MYSVSDRNLLTVINNNFDIGDEKGIFELRQAESLLISELTSLPIKRSWDTINVAFLTISGIG